MSKQQINLVEITGKSYKIGEEWQENFEIKFKINGCTQSITHDLKNGLLNALQEIYKPEFYDYSKFDTMYLREPKASKRLFQI